MPRSDDTSTTKERQFGSHFPFCSICAGALVLAPAEGRRCLEARMKAPKSARRWLAGRGLKRRGGPERSNARGLNWRAPGAAHGTQRQLAEYRRGFAVKRMLTCHSPWSACTSHRQSSTEPAAGCVALFGSTRSKPDPLVFEVAFEPQRDYRILHTPLTSSVEAKSAAADGSCRSD